MSHTCKNCGVEHDSNFCPECGTPAHVPDPPDPPRHRGYGAVMVAIGVLIGFIVGIGACMVYGVSLGLISFEGGLPAIVIQRQSLPLRLPRWILLPPAQRFPASLLLLRPHPPLAKVTLQALPSSIFLPWLFPEKGLLNSLNLRDSQRMRQPMG